MADNRVCKCCAEADSVGGAQQTASRPPEHPGVGLQTFRFAFFYVLAAPGTCPLYVVKKSSRCGVNTSRITDSSSRATTPWRTPEGI